MFRPKLDILPPGQRQLWPDLEAIPANFVLYGGTALALRLGHRQSIDFDFFCNETFEPERLFATMGPLRNGRVDQRGNNTLSLVIDKAGPVKLSFFGGLGMNRVYDPDIADNKVKLASLVDLTATKLNTIQQRAEAKDYRDLAAALEAGMSLEESLSAARAVFGNKFNPLAALKALTYFADGNLGTLPIGLQHRLQAAASTVNLDALPQVSSKPGILASGKNS